MGSEHPAAQPRRTMTEHAKEQGWMSDPDVSAATPSAADFLAYAKLHNGTCPTCGAIKAHDGSPRCKCLADLSPMGGGPNPWKDKAR